MGSGWEAAVSRGAHSWYRGVKGSRSLATEPAAASSPVARAEALAPGEMLRFPVGADWLGAARVRSRFAPIPLDAFDRAAPLLAAEEQAAYLHLLRLSYGEGRNFCRAPKRELMARLGLSERRLLRALAALVEKRFARPVHRDNRGTLWRVSLPCEALGEPAGDEVLLGRPAAAEAGPRPGPGSEVPAAGGGAAGSRPVGRGPVSLLGLAEKLCRARGREPGREALDAAAAEVADMLSEGHGKAQIEACIRAVARRGGRSGPPEEAAP
jgi:hypothetical protein